MAAPASHAGPGRGKTDGTTIGFSDRTNSREHTVARLKRDDPETAAKVTSGELSAYAAAREKGWRRPRILSLETKNPEVLDLLDQAMQREPSIHALYNVQGSSAPAGNTQARALRKLRRDAPGLHAQVLAGDLSPHAAMIRESTILLFGEPAEATPGEREPSPKLGEGSDREHLWQVATSVGPGGLAKSQPRLGGYRSAAAGGKLEI